MSMAMTNAAVGGKRRKGRHVHLRETHWGYVITSDTAANARAATVEMLCSFSGVILVLTAFGQWLAPGLTFAEREVLFMSLSSVLYAALGMVLLWYARRGVALETQIDVARGEVRTCSRNRHGTAHIRGLTRFADVGSAFIYRSRSALSPSRLYLRFRDTNMLIEVAQGSARELEMLLDRVASDVVATPPGRRARSAA